MDCKSAIIGLGNPGPQYAMTRHNIGFMLVDAILNMAADRKNMRLEAVDESGDYALWRVKFAGAYRLLVKPQTYMNLSGRAVSKICGRHTLSPAEIMVVHDELDLPVGRMKLKKGGGNNGHNGLESIQNALNTPDFHRLRLGVGRPVDKHKPISDWVLEPFFETDQLLLSETIAHAVKGLDIFFRRGTGFATQHINGFSPKSKEEKASDAQSPEAQSDSVHVPSS